jgi:hypothetical protein
MIEIRNATAQDAAESARVHVEADWETYAPLFGAEEYMLDVAESECDGRRRWAMVERCSLRQMPVAIADRIDALSSRGAITGRAPAKRCFDAPFRRCTREVLPRQGLTLWQTTPRRLWSISHKEPPVGRCIKGILATIPRSRLRHCNYALSRT